MIFNKINFYIENEKIRNFFSDYNYDFEFEYEICSLKKTNPEFSSEFINIFIVNSMPEKIFPDAKYILCFKNISELEKFNENQLDFFYDLLDENLIKFCFKKILKNIKSEIEYKYDYLTGLANRWLLDEFLEKNKNEENITAIYFDLDNFKKINDTYGHCAGDEILTDTAKIIKREFKDAFAVRMGGDEFLIIILGFISCEEVRKKVELFIKNLLNFYQSRNETENLSISAGISQKINGEKKSSEKLIYESDQALYKAKKNGISLFYE